MEKVIRTLSRQLDEIKEYILDNYKIPTIDNFNEPFIFNVNKPEHFETLLWLGKDFPISLTNQMHNAIITFWFRKIAILKAEKEKISQEDIETFIKQFLVKAYSNDWFKVLKKQIRKKKVDFIISETLLPIIELNSVKAANVNDIIQFDSTIIGEGEIKVIETQYETAKNGIVKLQNYDKKTDGRILKTIYHDIQHNLVEEIREDFTKKNRPRRIEVTFYGRDVGIYKQGDRVRVLGYYRAVDEKDGEFSVVVDSINIYKLGDEKEIKLSHKDLNKFKELSKIPDELIDVVTRSFTPHIFGNKIPKLACIITGIGAGNYSYNKTNLNLLITGNPGIGKSELLKYMSKTFQKAAYVDAPNASARGLLWSQEELGKNKILRAGVMLRHKIVCLDELDKMKSEERRELNTPIGNGIVSYHKNPFDIETEIDCSIVAASNPRGERWIDDRSQRENLEPLELPLLDRFIIVRIKREDNTKDRLGNFFDRLQGIDNTVPEFTQEQLTGFFNECRKINPVLPLEVKNMIIDFIIHFEGIEQDEQTDLPIDNRKEYDLIKIILAFTRFLLRDVVDEECVRFGIKFYKECLASIGFRTETPTAQTGLSDFSGDKKSLFKKLARDLSKKNLDEIQDGSFTEEEMLDSMRNTNRWKSEEDIEGFWEKVKREGVIYKSNGKAGRYSLV